jgi:hypothetical protein
VTTENGVGFPLINKDEADAVAGFFVVAVRKDDPRVLRLKQMTATEQEFRRGALQAAYQVYFGRDYRFPRIQTVETVAIDGQIVPIIRGWGFDRHTVSGAGSFQVRVYTIEVAMSLIDADNEYVLIGTPYITFWSRRDESPIEPLYTATELLRMIVSRLELN